MEQISKRSPGPFLPAFHHPTLPLHPRGNRLLIRQVEHAAFEYDTVDRRGPVSVQTLVEDLQSSRDAHV